MRLTQLLNQEIVTHSGDEANTSPQRRETLQTNAYGLKGAPNQSIVSGYRR